MNFIYQSFGSKVYFGEGHVKRIHEITKELDGNRLFVIAGERNESIVNDLKSSFGSKNVLHFSQIVQHVPKEIATRAIALCRESRSDLLIAIGGGSAIGLAKAIALENSLRILAVPTTFAGSEMTNIYGISSGGIKTVGRSKNVLPAAVIYDSAMTRTMPLPLAATSAMNAMAHLVEALYADDGNPITYQLSLTGIRFLKGGITKLASEKSLANANESLQFGSCLAGKALCEVSMSLHHKLAHVLGGSFGLDHSKTHTVLLPYVLQSQMEGLTARVVSDLQSVLEDENPPRRLRSLAEQMGTPTSLKMIGFSASDIPTVLGIMRPMKFPSPVAVNDMLLEKLLTNAFAGE